MCGRPSDLAVEIDQVLDRCYKQSRAVDTESLCIVAGEKVGYNIQFFFVIHDTPAARVHVIFSVVMLCHSELLSLCQSVEWHKVTR